MSNYKKHAIREFKAAGWADENGNFDDEWQKLICDQVVELLDIFAGHGHSGSSAPYAVGLFKQLAMFEPIVPLTGDDEEWNGTEDDTMQNNRCSHVFKGKDGVAYDIQGKVFREKNGCCYTSSDSRVYIEFPYTPKTEYVDV